MATVQYRKPVDDDIPWQQRLADYAQNPNAGRDEYKRAAEVFRGKSAAGDTEGANSAKTWMDQVNTSIGGAATQPNDDVRQAYQTYRERSTKPVTPFQYDANNDPSYQAALRQAQANAGTAQNNTLARLRANGQGKSSYSDTVANQIAQKEMSNVANTIQPQLMSQAYQRYRDNLAQEEMQNQNLLKYAGAVGDVNQQQFQNERTIGRDQRGDFESDRGYDRQLERDTRGDFVQDRVYDRGVMESDRGYDRGVLESDRTFGLNERQTNASIANMGADNTRSAAAEARAAGNQDLANRYEIWDRTGVAPEGIPGVRAGTPIAGKQQAAKSTDYKSNPDFASDVAFLKANPNEAKKLDTSPEAFINEYGYDGYLALRKAAGLDKDN